MGCSAASALAEGEASLQQEDAIGNQKSISLSRIATAPPPPIAHQLYYGTPPIS
jgi:hypothetical protein